MQTTNNPYIDSLKLGLTKMQSGLSFAELYEHLTSTMGWTFEESYLDYLRVWFHRNFYHKTTGVQLMFGTPTSQQLTIKAIQGYDDLKCIMTAEAYDMLQDYEKLQQAKMDAKKAQRLALWAIWISVILGVLQIVIGIVNN